MQDQRLVNRLQNYWELIRRGKPMPEINQFNAATIEDLWKNCLKLEASPGQGAIRYVCRYMGPKLVPMFGKDLTGMVMDSLITRYPYGVVVKMLDASFKEGKLMVDQNQFVNEKGKVIKYRACFLPFGNESRGVTDFIVGISDRTF